MVSFGYTLMTEQAGPKELVSHAVGAEQAGFDFALVHRRGDRPARSADTTAAAASPEEGVIIVLTLLHKPQVSDQSVVVRLIGAVRPELLVDTTSEGEDFYLATSGPGVGHHQDFSSLPTEG
jgi:hypothetical protein